MGHSKSSFKRKMHSDTGLHQETRKSQINNLLTLHLKKLGKKSNQSPELVEERK